MRWLGNFEGGLGLCLIAASSELGYVVLGVLLLCSATLFASLEGEL